MITSHRHSRLCIFLILLLWPTSGWASEISTMWSNIYRKAETLEQRSAIMARIAVLDDQDLIPLLIQSQTDLLHLSQDSLSLNERHHHNVLQSMIVKALGSLRAFEAGDVLFRTLMETRDSFLKAEAITSIGKIGLAEHADDLALILRNLNLGITILPTKEETETVATACITALERIKEPIGFEPVFFAAVGRYTQKVVKPAERSLERMVEDPSPLLGEILMAADDFNAKTKALEFTYSSQAPEEGKVKVAAIGLSEGLKHAPQNIRQMTALNRLRIKATEILKEFGYEDSTIVAELVRMLNLARTKTRDINEILACIQALGAGRGEAPVQALLAHLNRLNNLQQTGVAITDQREITQVIRSLGAMGNPLAQTELTQVEFSQWNGAVNREAKAALKKLQ